MLPIYEENLNGGSNTRNTMDTYLIPFSLENHLQNVISLEELSKSQVL